MSRFIFKGEKLRAIRFPLGGIGAGSVSIDGSGRFVDWEVANRPNKLTRNSWTNIAIKAECEGKTIGARVLQGPLLPPFTGDDAGIYSGYGYGPDRNTLAGVPHFDEVEMEGKFPVGRWTFGGNFPARVQLEAYSPFEPINDFDSSLPMGFFEVTLQNTESMDLEYSVAFSLSNMFDKKPVNRLETTDGITSLVCTTNHFSKEDARYGELCVSTDATDTSTQVHWYRGRWFDSLAVFWNDFIKCGRMKPRCLPMVEEGGEETGTICVHIPCKAGETVTARFVLSWYYPNFEKYWSIPADVEVGPSWKNWYATQFEDSIHVAKYGFQNWDRLQTATKLFVDTMFGSNLPEVVVDAAASTLAVLKSPTCVRLTDGSFYAWEGAHARGGSCEGSCTHVWNYQYALPYLFPKLERSMRDLDYRYNLRSDNSMAFRLQLPIGSPANDFHACVDGQLGGIIKVYREWMICGDWEWLRQLWPSVKKSLEYAWSAENKDQWDLEKTGVLFGRQHHTLDMELFGPSSWLTGFYLAALEAGARMASAMGDDEFAEECRRILDKGKKWVDENLWNGEYFIHKIDLKDKSILEKYDDPDSKSLHGDDIFSAYWNEEYSEIKYQIAGGSSIDQLLGQWHSDLIGLGDVFDPVKIEIALHSLMKNNFVSKMGESFNPCRLYCLQDEAGLVICSYPEGSDKPLIAVPYAEETMHGFEYAAACHMILRGMVEEGLTCIQAVRDRYDGERRNPWNEMECGSNYARSMAAWSFVNVWLGLSVDMTKMHLSFKPLSKDLVSIWSVHESWGRFEIAGESAKIFVLGGSLALRSIAVCGMTEHSVVRSHSSDEIKDWEGTYQDGAFYFTNTLQLEQGEWLEISFAAPTNN